MSPPLIRYGLDLTGTNPDNFVSNEFHTLERRRNRAAAPIYGAFFADSLIVTERSSGRQLTRGIHYVPIELYQTVSLMTGKDIFGAVLVIDKDVTSPIGLSYQTIGGEYSRSAQPLIDLLDKMPDDRLEYSWFDILNKPDFFKPTPHLHPIGDAVGFEHMIHALEKIRNAILWTDTPMYQNMLDYINTVLSDLESQMKYRMDSYMGPILVAFKRQLTKAFLGLGNVENLRLASEEEGRVAARADTRVSNFAERKYAALSTLVAFKTVLYENFVSAEDTNIGKERGVQVPPLKLTLLNMVNGAIGFIMSKAEARSSNTVFDSDIYPTGCADTDQFTIVKVTNNRSNRGGIFLAYQQQGLGAYIGVHSSGREADLITWRKFSFTDDLQTLTDRLASHISDTNNPHKLTKSQINLKNVENLQVISRGEVLCLDPVRKYVTFDALLLFMKSFMVGKNGGEVDPLNGTDGPLENVQILYCPSSNCACDEEVPSSTFAPADTLISQNCVGFNLVGTYANGAGGTYTRVITANSTECGYVAPADPTPTVSGLSVVTSVNSNLQWAVNRGKPNTQFTHQYSLAGQAPITNTYTLNSTGAYAGILNTGTAAGVVQSTFTFVNNYTVVENTTVQAQPTFTGTLPPTVLLNSASLSVTDTTLDIGDVGTVTVNLVGTVFGRTYNLEYWVKPSSESSFVRIFNEDIAPSYTANGVSGQFQFSLSNIDGTTVGAYNSYMRIIDSTNPNNSINTNTITVTYVAAPVTTPTQTPGPTATSTGGPVTPAPTLTSGTLLNNATLTMSVTDLTIGQGTNLVLTAGTSIANRSYNVALVGRRIGTTAFLPWTTATQYPRTLYAAGANLLTAWTETHSDTTLDQVVSIEVKAIITDNANSANRIDSNLVTVTLRPPAGQTPDVKITNVTIVPRSNPVPHGLVSASDVTVTGLKPGTTYLVDYYGKAATEANYSIINTLFPDALLPTKSFVATGNTATFIFNIDNTSTVDAGAFNIYCVVKESGNPIGNSMNSAVSLINTLGPTATTAPQTDVVGTKPVLVNYQGNAYPGNVYLLANGKLRVNMGSFMSGGVLFASDNALLEFTSSFVFRKDNITRTIGDNWESNAVLGEVIFNRISNGNYYNDSI